MDAGVAGGERSEGRRKMRLKVVGSGGGFVEAERTHRGAAGAHVEHARAAERQRALQGAHHGGHVVTVHIAVDPGPAEGFYQAAVGVRPAAVQGADVFFDGHSVVVDDQQHVGAPPASVVEGFEDHTAGHGSVADHRYAVALGSKGPIGAGKAHGRRKRGARVADAPGIKGRLASAREPAGPALSPVGRKHVGAPGEHLVDVGLVANVPNQNVVRSVQHPVKCHGELGNAKA